MRTVWKIFFRPVLFVSPLCACPMGKLSLATSEKREWKSGLKLWPFCEIFFILVKFPRNSEKKSDWFCCKKISQKLKYLNFKCKQSEIYFFVLFCSVSPFCACPMRKISLAKSVSRNKALGHDYSMGFVAPIILY